uniref:Accessory gland protein 1 n=1 Tax=Drosophila parisiena TaxID=214822 RepID=A0A1L3J110_9MUSC|nr:accessory gland protein 1 [Drosophila parisiena]APG58796.1 accessory gland protein 1 [Drosophila parisiena]
MQIVKTILVLSCLLLLGHNANGLKINEILECVQVAADSGSSLAGLAIPELKNTAACLNFVPNDTTNLGPQQLVDLIYDFAQRLFGKQKCVLASIGRIHAAVLPALQSLLDKNCLPGKSR